MLKKISVFVFALLFIFNVNFLDADGGQIVIANAANNQTVKNVLDPLREFVILSSESQKSDNGKNVIRFPPGKNIVVSDNPVSKDIIESFGKLIIIVVEFRQDNKAMSYAGSGFPIGKGLISTALHLILPSENDLIQAGFNMNSQMTITIAGKFCTPTHTVAVPLEKVGQGSKALEDIMILKADISEVQKKFEELGDNGPSAEKLSLLLFIQALKEGIPVSDKIELKEKSYVSGFFSLFGNIVPYIFEDQFTMELFTGYIEDSGIDFMHCFRGGIEPGFSGGPVFNGEGKVKAMSIGSSLGRNFIVGIPIKEIMEIAEAALEKDKKKENDNKDKN